MTFLFMLIGAALGAFFCAGMFDEPVGGTAALFGALIGLLLGMQRKLRARIAALEQGLLRAPVASGETVSAAPAPIPPVANAAQAQPDNAADIETGTAIPTVQAPAVSEMRLEPSAAVAEPARPALVAAPADEPRPPAESPAITAIKRWFTEGNVPVKVGVIVLFLGVAALFKYAYDQGWIHIGIEYRLTGVALFALGALVFAWRKRESHRNFALSLQGGAIGILILTIFAAFKLYALLPAGFAFALLVAVVAGGAMLAVLQDAIALAVLAIVGGFLAPILISTGQGSHVALFSYYAVLNAAVFAIAWIKPWRVLNLIGFAFTFGVGTLWGALQYRPEHFASTEPFLLLFFAFYLLVPLLYALRQPSERRNFVDGTLVFGTPLVAFALQVALLERARLPLAFSALGAAAIYAALATLELRRWRLTLLGQSHALLALGFATIAVPLALSARSTACTWAIEGAALVWLGLRQRRNLPLFLGCALQVFAGIAYINSFTFGHIDELAILNGEFLGALLIALSGFASSRLLGRANSDRMITVSFFVWAWIWWTFGGANEIQRFVASDLRADVWLGFFALTGLLGAEIHRRFDWRECVWPALAMFAFAVPLIGLTADDNHGPLEHAAALAWAFWIAAALRALAAFTAREERWLRFVHFVFLWILVLVSAVELGHLAYVHFALGNVWVALASLVPVALLFWLALRRQALVRWPSAEAAEATRHWLLVSLAGVMGVAWLLGMQDPGDPAPLPYVPLVNPLELAQVGYLLLLLAWFRQAERDGGAMLSTELRARALAAAGVILLTAITLRAAHFLGGVPWSEAMWTSPLAQAALSITWTLAGIAAMLLGKRRGSRAVWFGGAALMGVVLIKLLLIDRQFMHDLPAIIGVLVVGILLVAVGYFAPVPPRTATVPAPAGGNA
ncbi:MAG TPA: DUF2339 domain-containing protein [Rhodanobacteraceae bacterium]|nr:DUF2339 domain-containing protein [Rhodanobacteraceae bacterium]